jgi:hypothetical protein
MKSIMEGLMATSKSRLFTITEFLVRFGLFIYGATILALIGALFLSGIAPERITLHLGPGLDIAPRSGAQTALALCGLIAISAMMLPVLLKLLAVLRSAIAGDPFTRENGARLRSIGWLLLASYLIETLIMSVGFPGAAWLSFVTAPWRGLPPVLLFFVVARIFDQGAEMRADLAGTV